jgi:negative regulator of sigma E activity
MIDPVKEQLSTCLDGELPEAELDLLLKQVQRDPRLQQSVSRYSLISEVLRTGSSPAPSAGFASRISQAIAAESDEQPQQIAPQPMRRVVPRWIRPVGGAAIAAGVAAVAVMALQPQLDPVPEPAGATQIVSNAPALDNDSYIVPNAAPQMVPAAQLAKYLMPHSEYAGPLGRRAVWSTMLSDDEGELSDTVDIGIPATPDDPELQTDPALQRQP